MSTASNVTTAAGSAAAPAAAAPCPPAHFCCPITLQLMCDPVLAPDGNSYEREALVRWAAAKALSPPTLPTTNMPFAVDQLVPNRSLKDAIEEWRVANGLPSSDAPSAAATSAAAAALLAAPATAAAAAAAPVVVPIVVPETRYFSSPNGEAFIAVAPKTGPQRRLHVVVVVDVSGSMGATAKMKDESGENAEMANSVLDIVKYAAKAVAHMLAPDDCFSLVAFDSTATIELTCKPTRNDDDVKVIDAAIGRLRVRGQTNLGDGLRCGLQLAADHHMKDPSRLNVVMMLTDGQPNHGPVAVDVLKSFRRSTKVLMAPTATTAAPMTVGDVITNHTIVNTFGFGYSHRRDDIASNLMYEVATIGNGVFGYIPDIGFLGTQFIHCLANTRSIASVATCALGPDAPTAAGLWTVQYGTIGFSCRNVEALDAVDLSKPLRACAPHRQSAGADVNDNDNDRNNANGNANNTPNTPNDTATPPLLTEAEVAAVKAALPSAKAGFKAANVLLGLLRGPASVDCAFDANGRRCDDGVKLVPAPDTLGEDAVKAAFGEMGVGCDDGGSAASDGAITHSLLPGLAEDLKDQVIPAFTPAHLNRWGQHYLFSWLSAQQHRVCNNFKDKSLLTHKNSYVKAIHDAYDDIFNMMAPPEPTVHSEPHHFHRMAGAIGGSVRGGRGGVMARSMNRVAMNAMPTSGASFFGGSSNARTITSSSMINSSRNPCAHEDARLLMGDGVTMKAAKDIVSGDVIMTLLREEDGADVSAGRRYTPITVDHVIRTQCLDGEAQFVCFPPLVASSGADDDGAASAANEGLRITAWHPVRVRNCPSQLARLAAGDGGYVMDTDEWLMPADTGYPVETHRCAHVYSFTTTAASAKADHHPAIIVEGVPMVYLAHNTTSDGGDAGGLTVSGGAGDILAHPFFGTSAVLKQLVESPAVGGRKHHEFAYAPVVKTEAVAAEGTTKLLASAWDMTKYVGAW